MYKKLQHCSEKYFDVARANCLLFIRNINIYLYADKGQRYTFEMYYAMKRINNSKNIST